MHKFKAGQPTAATATVHEAGDEQSPADVAPAAQTFTLVLKSIASIGWGLDDVGKAADEAGLEWSRRSTGLSCKHVPGELISTPVAVLVQERSFAYSTGKKLHEVRLAMDLQEHSPQRDALHVMRRAADKMAEVLGADVLLENGAPVTEESLAPALKWVRSIHQVRRGTMRRLTTMPDGLLKEANPVVPWRAIVNGPKGQIKDFLYFDVEAEGYGRGVVRGHELMLQLLTNIKGLTHPQTQDICIGEAIAEALGVKWRKAVKSRGKSRANVAAGMTAVVEDALRFYARHANFERWLQSQIAMFERMAQRHEAEDEVEREHRSIRAKIAHAKKRQICTAPATAEVPLNKKTAKAAGRKAVTA